MTQNNNLESNLKYDFKSEGWDYINNTILEYNSKFIRNGNLGKKTQEQRNTENDIVQRLTPYVRKLFNYLAEGKSYRINGHLVSLQNEKEGLLSYKDDLIQEGLIQVIDSMKDYNGKGSFSTLISTTVPNRMRRYYLENSPIIRTSEAFKNRNRRIKQLGTRDLGEIREEYKKRHGIELDSSKIKVLLKYIDNHGVYSLDSKNIYSNLQKGNVADMHDIVSYKLHNSEKEVLNQIIYDEEEKLLKSKLGKNLNNEQLDFLKKKTPITRNSYNSMVKKLRELELIKNRRY